MKGKSLMDKIRELEDKGIRKYVLKGRILNLHGEHASRVQLLGETVVQQVDKALEESDLKDKKGVKKETAKTLKRTRVEKIHTFPRNDKGELLAPLGGQRGYILAMMKVAANNRYKRELQNKRWEGYGLKSHLENGVFVKPQWVTVGRDISNPPDQPLTYMVQTAGRSRSITWQYYDYIKESSFEVTVEVESPVSEDILLNLFASIQRLGMGPKRRGQLILEDVIKLQ